jgi:hypothetical protein
MNGDGGRPGPVSYGLPVMLGTAMRIPKRIVRNALTGIAFAAAAFCPVCDSSSGSVKDVDQASPAMYQRHHGHAR